MKFARRKSRRAIAGIVATVIMFAILFTVGTSYFVFVNSENANYVQSLLKATSKVQGSLAESLTITSLLETNGDVGFFANNTSSVSVNMTAVLVISSTGLLLKCDGVGFPGSAGCSNTIPSLWMTMNPSKGSPTLDTGYVYSAGTTVTLKVLTARGDTYSATYPAKASQSASSQSVTVNLDNLKWVQLIPQASALAQKNYVSNCNAQNCAEAFTSSVTAGNILVDGISWVNQAPPASVPTDTRNDLFTLGASSSVPVSSTAALVQNKYTSNCNAASCGLTYTSAVTSGHVLVYSLGWANQSPPTSPTDTRGDAFTLGASQSVTVNPATPTVVQHRYAANCNSATCALAYSSSVTAGNTLVLGLGWPSNQQYNYVPVTLTNNQISILATDGSATGHFSSGSSGSVTLTTTNSNDIIVVLISDENVNNARLRAVNSVTSSGLTFAQEASNSINSGPYDDSEIWWALASSPLAASSISVTLAGSIDTASIAAFGVSGANIASPWDPNGSIPKTATSTSSSVPTVSGVSTTNANDMLLGFTGIGRGAGSGTTEAAGAGYTLVQQYLNSGGTGSDQVAAEYKIVSATQSSVSVAFSASNADWIALAGALQQAPSTATPAVFQQLVTWNPSSYSTYEASNLGNVRFCADTLCNTPLYAWLQSCTSSCSPSATSASSWVRLASSIAGNGGTLTIYLVFEAMFVNFDGNYWGEAPTLSGAYGQYDNGANVFTFYDNFAGNSLSGKWTTVKSSGGSVTVNNGATVAVSSSSDYVFISSSAQTYPLVAESYFVSESSSTMLALLGVSTSTSYNGGSGGFGLYNGYNVLPYTGTLYLSSQSSGGFGIVASQGESYTAGIYGVTWPATGSESGTDGSITITGTDNSVSAANYGIYIGLGAGTAGNAVDQWARMRAYAPNGVAPSNSLGGLVKGTASPISVSDTLGDTFTLGVTQSAASGSTTYVTDIWYATAASSGADTITATFSLAVTGSVSIYEILGYTTSGVLSSSGSSTGGSTAASVGSFTPGSNSFVVGNVETGSAATRYTVGAGYATVASGAGGCDASDASQGCDEYESGLGSATTAPFTLSSSTPWADVAMSFAPLSANTYYSYVWYATAASSGADTITATFSQSVAGSVSIYEVSGVTATGLLTSTGSSTTSQAGSSVTSIAPTAGSVVIGNAETTSTTYTAGASYTLSGSCSSVSGCGEYQTGVGSATTVPISISPSSPWVEAAIALAPIVTTYYSYIWYATAGSSGADTITAAFSATVTASVSIYEITGYTTSGALSSTGSSAAGSTTSSVTSFAPSSDSFIVGATESGSASTTFTAASSYTLVGSCSSVYGCSEYYAGGGGSASTVPLTLSSSTPWVESAMSFSTPFNPQSGIQVGGYPTMGVTGGVAVAWEVTFTNVDPSHRSITIWPQTEMAIGSAEFDGFDIDYTQAHYYLIDGLNVGSTTVNGYTATTGVFLNLAYNVPTTLFFAATAALGSNTQAFGNNYGTPFEAYFALTGVFSDGTLFGETIPYPYGIITQSNAYTTPTAGATGTTVTVSCTSPCYFNANAKAMVGWINSAGQLTQMTTFTTTGAGNIPSGVTFQVPTASTGYYTLEVTDYVNSVFMTFQHT